MEKLLIILDDPIQKGKENILKASIGDICQSDFFHTKYETKEIQFMFRMKFIGNMLSHISYWLLSLKYACLLLSNKYSQHNRKIFINPIVGIFYALLRRFFPISETIIIAGFLFSPKRNKLYYVLRKAFVSFSYKNVSQIVVYSNNEKEYYSKIFQNLGNKIVFVQYGRDYPQHRNIDNQGAYIFSGGGSNRDYKTLCEAMHHVSDIKCIIATRPTYIDEFKAPNSVEIKYNVTVDTFGAWIKHSTFFVLPIIDTQLSAGHMALFEAMKNGKLTIVADIPAIRDYVDEECVLFYKPEDAQDLAKIIRYAVDNYCDDELRKIAQNAYEKYYNQFTFEALLRRLCIQSLK